MPDRRIVFLGLLLALSSVIFLGWGLKGNIGFILELRAVKLAALILVGASIGVATVMFQTISSNRILTPEIMGFDALFLLLQAVLLFLLGGVGYAQLPVVLAFIFEALLMIFAAVALFGVILGRRREDIHLLILIGVVFGLLFRSLTNFVLRLIDPSEFSMIQGAMFASFGSVNRIELALSAAIFIAALIWMIRYAAHLDVAALGRGAAQSLGLNFDRFQMQVLAVIAALVSVSTALVGPITFLGLLVASLAHILMRTHRHALLLPAAALISASILVIGQTVFERLLSRQSTLAVVIEFFGGLLFLWFVIKGRVR